MINIIMDIIDITDIILSKIKKETNLYCFNPSITHYKNDIYLIVYRITKYDVQMELHPWKIWDNGYKYFIDPRKVIDNKYRSQYGNSILVDLNDNDLCLSIPDISEYDSTGLSIVSFNGIEVNMIKNYYCIFGNEMNQDSRIAKYDNQFVITYNVFESEPKRISLRYRLLDISPDLCTLNMSEEKYMFDHLYRNVEKNCTFMNKNDILYGIESDFKVVRIINNEQIIISKTVQPFANLINHYGKDNICISLGTPSIPYKGLFLSVGHIKIQYKKLFDIEPANIFLSKINFDSIHKHGRYIYFMFLFTFDADYNVINISRPFIPSIKMNHMPYLLVYPAGLTFVNDKIAISYGEGDCRCKILLLEQKLVNKLLSDKFDYGFYFLSNMVSIQHFGYFGNGNTGDDAFIKVFEYLRKKYYPYAECKYSGKFEESHDLNIIGGGDIINEYFMGQIKNASVIAVGVGIPYPSNIHYLQKCDSVILRNINDAKKLGYTYYPDLTFLLPKIFQKFVFRQPTKIINNIGFCLTRTYYHSSYPELYDNYVNEIVKLIDKLINGGYNIHLIPFCFNQNNRNECDLILMNDIKKYFPENKHVVVCFENRTIDNFPNNVEEILYKISEMDFVVCTRFHSHIFCTIARVPFVSLTCGRKCIEYMRDAGLSEHVYKLKTNHMDIPIKFSSAMFHIFLMENMYYASLIRSKINSIMQTHEVRMNDFENYWVQLINEHIPVKNFDLYPVILDSSAEQRINHTVSGPVYQLPLDRCLTSSPKGINPDVFGGVTSPPIY